MFAAILAAIQAIPKLVELVQGLIKAIERQVDAIEKANLIAAEESASKKAIETKDTSDLEKVFRGG